MEKKQEGLSVTWLSVWMNIALGALKCAIGLMAHSAALLADGLHSLVDLSTDVVALFGLKMAAKPRDDNHPYGHHRFASLSSLFIGLALLGFCVGLIISSLHQLVDGDSTDPAWPALAAAAVSLVAKEWLFLRTRRIARQEKSTCCWPTRCTTGPTRSPRRWCWSPCWRLALLLLLGLRRLSRWITTLVCIARGSLITQLNTGRFRG